MPKFLNAGSGPKVASRDHIFLSEFKDEAWTEVRLDADPRVEPDVAGDLRLLGTDHLSDVFDGVWCSHVLEHFEPHEAVMVLKGFHHVLKFDCLLGLMVPNFQAACQEVANGFGSTRFYDSPAGPISALDMIFGHERMRRDNPLMCHRTGFTPDMLRGLLFGTGFLPVAIFLLGEQKLDILAVALRK